MRHTLGDYLTATRHPWACVLFVLPLLLAFEIGVRVLPEANGLRTGADVWARQVLGLLGLTAPLAAPLLLIAGLLTWGMTRPRDELQDPVGTWAGMAVESAGFAALLFGLVRLLFPVLAHLGGALDP